MRKPSCLISWSHSPPEGSVGGLCGETWRHEARRQRLDTQHPSAICQARSERESAKLKHVAFMSHGAADSRWQSLKMLRNIMQHTRHENECYRAAKNGISLDFIGGRGRTRTGTPVSQKQILSLLCLPFHHAARA